MNSTNGGERCWNMRWDGMGTDCIDRPAESPGNGTNKMLISAD